MIKKVSGEIKVEYTLLLRVISIVFASLFLPNTITPVESSSSDISATE